MTAYDTAIDAIGGGPTWHAKLGEGSGTALAARVGPGAVYSGTGVTYGVTGLVANNAADTAVTLVRASGGKAEMTAVNANATFDGGAAHTYSIRITPTGTPPVGGNQNVLSRVNYGLFLDTSNKPTIFCGAAFANYAAVAAVTVGVPITLSYTFGSGVHKVYVDTTEVISATDTRVTGGELALGSYPGGGGDLSATVDEPKFWPVALTPAQILAVVNADTGAGGGGGGASAQTNRLLMGVG